MRSESNVCIRLFGMWFTSVDYRMILSLGEDDKMLTVGNSQSGNPHFEPGLPVKEVAREFNSATRGVSQLFVPPSNVTCEEGMTSEEKMSVFNILLNRKSLWNYRPLTVNFCPSSFYLIFDKFQSSIVDCRTLNVKMNVRKF